MDGWIGGWMEERIDGWMDRGMNRWELLWIPSQGFNDGTH